MGGDESLLRTKEVETTNSEGEGISDAGKSRGGMYSKKSNEDVREDTSTSPFDLFLRTNEVLTTDSEGR
eukprot:scaffold17775_cov94-Skeletonema_dohrnii-CCMP3373.AAC.1